MLVYIHKETIYLNMKSVTSVSYLRNTTSPASNYEFSDRIPMYAEDGTYILP